MQKKDITFKGKKDLVTQYDVAVENFLKEKFSKEFTQFNIIAEESNNQDVQFNNSIIIDPIDGTTNFVNQVPHCAISVGVYQNQEPLLAIVYNPILDELYTAQKNKGAFLNGEKLFVSKDNELKTSLVATGFPYSNATNQDDLEWVIRNLKSVLPNVQDIRRLGSAAIDLCLVARGTYAAYYEINLKAWDVSAGILILQEAGGKITNIKNDKYNLFEDKCLVASNSTIHTQILEKLN
jgi:myo-inositol-1(or 4)-monophosphatase